MGLPLATYFSGPKVRWILDNVDGAREKAEAGDLLFGNIDAWVLWNLTGGAENGGVHVTDVTNASRTMLMDLSTLSWDEGIAADMKIPMSMLPEIKSSSEVYGECKPGVLNGVPVAGILGDQQAATFGQACLEVGMAKNTYGTGNFMLLNTGEEQVPSENGLLTTVCYKIGDNKPIYALEGSIAVTGSLVQWLRDNLGLIKDAPEIEELAKSVDDNGGAYFVPAFSGLFAPYWRSDARGALVGLTRYVNKGHIARAVLEATAFQTREVLDAMNADSGVPLTDSRSTAAWSSTRRSCSSRPTSSASTWSGRRSPRRRRWVRRTPPASRSATGSPRTTSATTGARTSVGHRRWTRLRARRRSATGRRPSPRPSTGSTTTSTSRPVRGGDLLRCPRSAIASLQDRLPSSARGALGWSAD